MAIEYGLTVADIAVNVTVVQREDSLPVVSELKSSIRPLEGGRTRKQPAAGL